MHRQNDIIVLLGSSVIYSKWSKQYQILLC